ncbi:MAG TPA: lasso peptide biosynthesis B2 protein [Reyranella sp.]|nr:lasso peptide biosynthesis B2 protein [Reyranella sp.]
MQLVRKVGRFLQMSQGQRLMLVEAALFLGASRLLLLTAPFGRIAPWLQRSADSGSHDARMVLAVGQAITIASRNVPWNAVCLPQAMAAKAMLARRGQGSALHLGAARARSGLTAHAWLEAGGEIVVGKAGIADVIPLARFG